MQKARCSSLTKQLILSGALTGVIFLFWFIVNDIVLHKSYTPLTKDLATQYIRFIIWGKHAIFNTHEFVYSFNKGFGGEMYSTWAYYVISPFNILFLVTPNKMLPCAVLVIEALKISFGSMTMCWYLAKSEFLKLKNKDYLFVFALSYSLSTWVISNQFNIIWLDILWLMPLYILSLENLFSKKPYLVFNFIILVFLMLIINYYMAYMVGLFSLVYAGLYLDVQNSQCKIRQYVRFIVNGLVGLLLSCFLTLPTFYQLMLGKNGTMDSSNLFNSWDKLISLPSLFDLFSRVNMGFSGDADLMVNQAQIFTSIFTMILVFIYLFYQKQDKYNEKRRTMYLTLFILLFIGVVYQPVNMIYHAGQLPVGYNYRYMFIWAFLVVATASREFDDIRDINLSKLSDSGLALGIAGLCSLIFLMLPQSIVRVKPVLTHSDIIISLCFLGLILYLMYKYINKKRKVYLSIISLITMIQLCLNVLMIDNKLKFKTQKWYSGSISVEKRYNYLSKNNTRVGRIAFPTDNGALVDNINDLSSFNSNTDNLTRMWHWYMGDWGDRNTMDTSNSNIVQDNLVSKKYYLVPNEFNYNYLAKQGLFLGPEKHVLANPLWSKRIRHDKDFSIYELKDSLPFGFLAGNSIYNAKFNDSWANNINSVLNSLANTHAQYVKRVFVQFKFKHVPKGVITTGHIKFKTNNTYYLVKSPHEACVRYKLGKTKIDSRMIGGAYMHDYNLEIASRDQGKTGHLYITQNTDHRSWRHIYVYELDDHKIAKVFKKSQNCDTKLISIGHSEMVFNVNSKAKRNLVVTVPAVPGWNCYINGQEAKIKRAMGTWLSVQVPHGKSRVVFKYQLPLLKLGIFISLATTFLLGCYGILMKNTHKVE